MSIWSKHDVESKVRAALVRVRRDGADATRPFITAYQLAIALEKQDPGLCEKLDKVLGGEGIGRPNSLVQYIASQLVQRIERQEIKDIERAFLSVEGVVSMEFSGDVRSSAAEPMSMFRIKDNVS
ncbi:MAG: hypothetical protein GX998_06170 [Firmicutes bacterium]|nr:hypothetical protein [Bacillota bacterium]